MDDRRDLGALLWGIAFALAAGLLLWDGTGHHVPVHQVLLGAPFVLILLGILGLVLSSRGR
ncbi:hypothetical protein [Luteococcus sp. OSA5]|uniref:hypothetical protein n=1 Tax=Luteococcus sp. OSA5 TaxID=3401630 RepID=UPI003B43AB9C